MSGPAAPDTSLPQYHIAAACEEDLSRHGDSFRGVGYTKSPREATERYELMLGVIRERNERVSLLDLGCGLAHLLDYISTDSRYDGVVYAGIDISPKYVAAASTRHRNADLRVLDVLALDAEFPDYDYVVMNGLFNYRGAIGEERMLSYWKELVSVAYRHCRRGIAFNVMSKLVEWEREDLFHLPFDVMAGFVASALSRHLVIRHDYEAYEYTTYVYRSPSRA